MLLVWCEFPGAVVRAIQLSFQRVPMVGEVIHHEKCEWYVESVTWRDGGKAWIETRKRNRLAEVMSESM